MKDLSISSFVFDLIKEFEIVTPKGELTEFTDEGLELFYNKYITHAGKRDLALNNYFQSTPNLFRTHLPFSSWSIPSAIQLVWYYDEIVINDPILQLQKLQRGNNAVLKKDLRTLLSMLLANKDSVTGGYILFAGEDIFPSQTGAFDQESKILTETPEVIKAYEQISLMVKKPSPINDNPIDNLIQIEVLYQGFLQEIRSMGMYIPPHVMEQKTALTNGVFFDFMSPYQRITSQELVQLNKQDMLKSLREAYCKDISLVLEAITNAQRYNIPILFNRDAECIAAKSYSSQNSNMLLDQSVYDCVLPYVNNIPPERLFDVRNQVPNAFLEFRAFLFDLVSKTMKATDNPAELKYKIDTEISSTMRKLKVEMENAKGKWNFQGLAAPITVVAGSLGVFALGGDYSKLISAVMSTGGVGAMLSKWSDFISDKNKAALSPVYFLWKAQQS